MPQKKRTTKTSSRGRRSSASVPLTEVEKVNLGGGILRSFKPLTAGPKKDRR